MTSFFCTGVLLLCAFAGAAAQTLPADGSTLLLLRFDGNAQGVQGEQPSFSSGLTYVPGISGQAAKFTASSQLRFAAGGNISGAAGTIQFWIKPDWPGANGTGNVVLAWGEAGGLMVLKDG